MRAGRVFIVCAGAAIVAACHGAGGDSAAPGDPHGLAARLEDAARACAKIASCAHPHDGPRERNPGECFDAWVARARVDGGAFGACVARANSCAEVDTCVRARGDAVATAFCRAHPAARAGCEGARLVSCTEDDPNEATSIDCGAFGGTCGEAKQAGGLVAWACLSPSLCPAGAPEARCVDRTVVACHDGAVDRTECSANARCEEHKAAGAVSAICEPPMHRHCTTVGTRWCEGSHLVACQAHGPYGETVDTDCGAMGLACGAKDAGEATCVVPGARVCDRAATRCEGDALSFCAVGRAFRVPCRALGFASCDPDAHGVDAACSISLSAAPGSAEGRPEHQGEDGACSPPSVVRLRGPDDARDPAALASCSPDDAWARMADGEQTAAARCESAGRRIDAARVLEGALPLDAPTRDHVRHVFRAGRSLGRRDDAFGLVGDSLTLDISFLRPFSVSSGSRLVVPADVERALAAPWPSRGTDVVDFFRRARVPADAKLFADSFMAPRAARVGARATWPLEPRGMNQANPIEDMVTAISPAYAVVLYGTNDALWRTDTPRLVREFDAALSAIVDALESRGIVPILTTIPKHMRERGYPDCPTAASRPSNELFAVQATALSADVASLACRRHVPLVDLRWSLDPLVDHGVGPDGIHLSLHSAGGGVLDASGLQCGYNVRNLVTLRELALVVRSVSE